MKIKHASIVPLIGGETIAQQQVMGSLPSYILTYSVFKNNESHLREYYKNKVPYYVLDEAEPSIMELKNVDVINTVCPCAGLSSLSPSASNDSKMNEWMYESANFVLGKIKPEVFWGENAPRLSSPAGKSVADKLKQIGKVNGYTLMFYKTKSILHGLSQVRDRTFYFFFKGDQIPVFPFFKREHKKIEDAIREAKASKDDPMSVLVSKKKPSKDDPFYRYVLEVMNDGMTHKQFQRKIEKSTGPMEMIEAAGISYLEVAKWFKSQGFSDKLIERCHTIDKKLKAGGNVMRKITEIPKDYIGAFVGHLPHRLTHPDQDRYLSIRECLALMAMPPDFILQGGVKNLNHICQNVPVTTARDMAQCIKDYLDGKLDTITSPFAIINNKDQTIDSEIRPESLEKFLT